MTFSPRFRWLLLTLFVVIADRFTKALIESRTAEGWRHEVIPNFFYLVHSKNPGIAFSMFADSHSPWTRLFLIVSAILVIGVISWLFVSGTGTSRLSLAGLALLLGGAAGNLTDRILHGAVTDFVELWFGSYRYPAFNIADSAITIGAILVLFDILLPAKKSPKS